MASQFWKKFNRVAAIGLVALLLATTACGTTKGTALTPAAVVGAQQAHTSMALTSDIPGDAYLTADGQYGVAGRTSGGTTQASDLQVCTTSGSICLEP